MSNQTIDSNKTLKRLFAYTKRLKHFLVIAVLGNLLYALMDVALVSLTEPLLDEGLFKNNHDLLYTAPLFIVGILIIRGIASIISVYFMDNVGQSVVKMLRTELANSYIYLPNAFFDKTSSGELIAKVTYNTQQIASASSDAITKSFREGATIFYALGYMFYTSWKLTLVYLIAGPVIAVLVSITSKRFKKVSHNIQKSMGGITQVTQEVVEGYKVIKTFGGEEYEKKRFDQVAKDNRKQQLKLTLAKAISTPLIQLIAGIALALVVFVAIFEIQNGALSNGEFVTMMLMMMLILRPLKVLSNINVVLQQGITAAASVFDIIDHPKEDNKATNKLTKAPEKISFNRVDFYYPESKNKILNQINFEAIKGQTIAIVGKSGSGKSTLTSLLLRFYQTNSGDILFDDKSINEFELTSLRSNIAFVSQQVVLFNDTVTANIAYGAKNVDKEKLKAAAEKAHAISFIEKLDNGFDSLIGENGSKLSGGQRQRLAIARAIYKNSPIIILDEATSALDTQSERHIQAALEALTENKTTFVIAHRLSTIENADKIVVMEEGEIVEIGTHTELLKADSVYAQLHAIQFVE